MLCACVVGVIFLCVIGTCSLGFPGISVAGCCVCCLLLCWVLFGVLGVWLGLVYCVWVFCFGVVLLHVGGFQWLCG